MALLLHGEPARSKRGLQRSRAHVLAEANFHQMYITFFSACKDKKILFQQALGLFADPNTTDIVN